MNSHKSAWPAIVFMVNSAPRTVREVARFLGHDYGTVVRAFKRLEVEGLVTRQTKRGIRGGGCTPDLWTWSGK